MLPFERQQFFERKLLVDVARSVPQHHVPTPGELLDIGTQIAVGSENHGLVGGNRLHDLQRVGRRAANVGQGLHADRGVHIGDDRVTGMRGLESRKFPGVARLGQRAPRLGTGDQHLLFGAEDLGGLGHEVHSGEEDDVGVDRLRPDGEGERVAQKIGDGLHLGRRVVVRQDHGVFLALEIPDAAAELGGVFHVHFLFLFL